jgi:small subunit ribosomal protein S3
MALEKRFVKEAIRNLDVEEFLSKEFDRAEYSHCEIQRTPLSIRITVYAHKPGIIIGRGGKNIDNISHVLKTRFGFENPQLDVQEVREPDLDPFIVARSIASAIERNVNYKRVVKLTIERVMHAGAVGIGIRVSGKLGGDVSRAEKFSSGYLKYSGEPAETDILTAYSQANVKLGIIGIQVRIMTKEPSELKLLKEIEEGMFDVPSDAAKEEVKAEVKADVKIEEEIEEKMEVEDLGDIKEKAA